MMLGVREKGNPVGAVVGGRRERGKEVERGKRGGGGVKEAWRVELS